MYRNLYFFVIGYSFSTRTLGFYTKAQQFQAPLSGYITGSISNISFPILASIQEDNKRLKSVFAKFLKFSVFLNFTAMALLAALAEPLVLILIGEKWETAIFYLQLLCIPGMLYPLQLLNLDILVVKGFSDKYLLIEIIKKSILVPLVFITANYSIEVMLYGFIAFSMTEYFINSFYCKKIIGYGSINQIKDVGPYLIMSLILFLVTYGISFSNLFMDKVHIYWQAIIQISLGLATFIVMNEFFRFEEYKELKKRFKTILSNIG